MMRVTLDTNVIISGLFWKGKPNVVLAAAVSRQFLPLASEALLTELRQTLIRSKFDREISRLNLDRETIIQNYWSLVEMVESAEVPDGIIRDPKDQAVLGCAVGGNTEYIVSGDQDLLVLNMYQNVKIVTAEAFLKLLPEPE